MDILLANPFAQYKSLKSEIDDAIQKVNVSGRWLQGEENIRFSRAFSQYIGVDHCLPVGNGTDALELGLRALDVNQRDEIITVANAGGYSTTAIRICGATPVYVDIDPETYLVDVEAVFDALSDNVRGIVLTHLYGRAIDVYKIKKGLKDRRREDVFILEDCAQAHGAKVGSKMVGAMGDLATFSFYPTKNLGALGDAGAICTNNKELFDRVKRLSQYGWIGKYRSIETYGRNSRMDEYQAAVLNVKLSHLDYWNEKRRKIVTFYDQNTSKDYHFSTSKGCDFVGHLAVVSSELTNEIKEQFENRKIGYDVHYPILDFEQQSQIELPKRVHSFENSKKLSQSIVSLPCYPELPQEQIDVVTDALVSL